MIFSKKNIPTVLALDDCWFYTGGCTHYTVTGCSKWKTGCGKCPNRSKEGTNWFFDRTAKICKDRKAWYERIPRLGIAGVSNWITNEARKSYVLCSKKDFCNYI